MPKCIYCGKKADFLAHGSSLCKKHLKNYSSYIPCTKEFLQFAEPDSKQEKAD